MIKFVANILLRQVQEGRLFLLDNPHRIRLCELDIIKEIPDPPEVVTVVGEAGAFRAEIVKLFKFMGNTRGMTGFLGQKLSHPASSTASLFKARAPNLARSTALLTAWVSQMDPQRFGKYEVWAATAPVEDLSQRNSIFTEIEAAFVNTARRPYNLDLEGKMAKDIADLLRMGPDPDRNQVGGGGNLGRR
ncbi:unnamed protein product [Effrenium voratum]|nr:unnamed protein product [Effrenium voratum]